MVAGAAVTGGLLVGLAPSSPGHGRAVLSAVAAPVPVAHQMGAPLPPSFPAPAAAPAPAPVVTAAAAAVPAAHVVAAPAPVVHPAPPAAVAATPVRPVAVATQPTHPVVATEAASSAPNGEANGVPIAVADPPVWVVLNGACMRTGEHEATAGGWTTVSESFCQSVTPAGVYVTAGPSGQCGLVSPAVAAEDHLTVVPESQCINPPRTG